MFWIFMGMLIVTIFRELAVASIRLIASTKANVVVAANMLGKVKTVTQIICIILALVEPVAHDLIGRAVPDFFFGGFYALTYLVTLVAIVFTVLSGINYIAGCWKYLDPEK
jgi:CDP-diacylglycerol--glycerol-3-phosphate 3-phosphatidyltransferase